MSAAQIPPAEADLVFNVVWTGTTFAPMRHFVQSLMAHSTARFRFVANHCPPDQLELMEAFRARHADQVVEVIDVSPDVLESHGFALEAVRSQRDDGDWFCFVDPDIKANGPWVQPFIDLLTEHDVVTSGTEVWTDGNQVPDDTWGVAGEHFFAPNGFVFGSPHLAVYRQAALSDTCTRWGITFGSAGPELTTGAIDRLADLGLTYKVYDTAKLVNALMQADGHRLVHRDIPELVHIGGLAHFMSPAYYLPNAAGELEPEWTRWGGDQVETRHAVTRFTASVLLATQAGREAPEVPADIDGPMATKLETVRREVIDMVARYHDPAS